MLLSTVVVQGRAGVGGAGDHAQPGAGRGRVLLEDGQGHRRAAGRRIQGHAVQSRNRVEEHLPQVTYIICVTLFNTIGKQTSRCLTKKENRSL